MEKANKQPNRGIDAIIDEFIVTGKAKGDHLNMQFELNRASNANWDRINTAIDLILSIQPSPKEDKCSS